MDSLNFEIILNYTMKTFSIKPPSSYMSLIEIIREKFDLTIVNRLVYLDDDEEEKGESNAAGLEKFMDL